MSWADFLLGPQKEDNGIFGSIFGQSSEYPRPIPQPTGTTYTSFGKPYKNKDEAGRDYAKSIHPGGQCECIYCHTIYDNAYDANNCKCTKPWEA